MPTAAGHNGGMVRALVQTWRRAGSQECWLHMLPSASAFRRAPAASPTKHCSVFQIEWKPTFDAVRSVFVSYIKSCTCGPAPGRQASDPCARGV